MVIGVGSPFADDRVGWEVIKRLQRDELLTHFTPETLQLTYCDRPGLSLIHNMSTSDAVFLIDAVYTGAPPGTLHLFTQQKIASIHFPLSSHGVGVAEAIELGGVLGLLPPVLRLYGVEILPPKIQFELTPIMEISIQQLAKRIKKAILILLDPK